MNAQLAKPIPFDLVYSLAGSQYRPMPVEMWVFTAISEATIGREAEK